MRRLLVNHLIDYPEAAASVVMRIAAALDAPYEVLIHDYWFVCPRVDLVDASGRYCGLAPAQICRACVGQDVAARRDQAATFLAAAARVIAPSDDAATRLRAALPGLRLTVLVPEAAPEPHRSRPRETTDTPVRVAVPGALNQAKGAGVVLALAEVVRRRRLGLRIIVVGPAVNARALRRVGVAVTGRYPWGEGAARLAETKPDLILLPAIWPETWSFTLTEALEHGATVVSFDIGAPAERLRRYGRGVVLPYALHARPAELADALLALTLTGGAS